MSQSYGGQKLVYWYILSFVFQPSMQVDGTKEHPIFELPTIQNIHYQNIIFSLLLTTKLLSSYK